MSHAVTQGQSDASNSHTPRWRRNSLMRLRSLLFTSLAVFTRVLDCIAQEGGGEALVAVSNWVLDTMAGDW